MKRQKKIGLALGSGGFRGFAHIGVIRSLIKHDIPIDFLSGASIGAWVAAYYAIFGDIDKLADDVIDKAGLRLPVIFDLSLTGGFIGGMKFMNFLDQNLQHRDFSDLKIPTKIIATNLVTGQAHIFATGDVARAVRASTSVPLVFKPVSFRNELLVDGGLSNPVPVDLVREMGADIVIGVNLYNKNEFIAKKFTMPKVALRSTRIAMHNLAKIAISHADIIIEPDTSKYIQGTKMKKYFTPEIAEEMIMIGEKAADKLIPGIKALLAGK